MALIQCPECSAEVSDSAMACPKCAVQLRKPKRSFMGKLFKWGFVAFNVIMAIWIFGGVDSATDGMDAMSEVERAGTAIGAGIGVILLLGIWVAGDIVLGLFVLFTRPKSS